MNEVGTKRSVVIGPSPWESAWHPLHLFLEGLAGHSSFCFFSLTSIAPELCRLLIPSFHFSSPPRHLTASAMLYDHSQLAT